MKRKRMRRRSDVAGCCTLFVRLREENTRFVLLAVLMVAYLSAGALLFQYLEGDEEVRHRLEFAASYSRFLEAHNGTVDVSALDRLLYEYGNASAIGVLGKRPRWDFSGSFYFAGTVVSTIGYGMTTPRTPLGKALVVIYGLLGCSGAILFFNLFLERIITLLAFIMRHLHEWDLRRRGFDPRSRRDEDDNFSEGETSYGGDLWKPSVYWVMIYLFLVAVAIAALASVLYSRMESWSYLESLYVCFVSFATIGFGDYVPSQEESYPSMHVYRLANFVILVVGCCCVYSLFNVTSIIIKQFLNSIIARAIGCRCDGGAHSRRVKQASKLKLRVRRNAITPNHLLRSGCSASRSSVGPPAGGLSPVEPDFDSNYDSDGGVERRISGDLPCVRDFLHANKVSLAVMQKQLYETAHSHRGSVLLPLRRATDAFLPATIGPLAIVTSKLQAGDE